MFGLIRLPTAGIGAAGLVAVLLTACGQNEARPVSGQVSSTHGATVASEDVPRPRQGLWRVSVEVETPAGKMTLPANEICQTEESLKAPDLLPQTRDQECSPLSLRRDGNAYSGKVTCRSGTMTADYSLSMSGDLNREYRTEILSRVTPAPAPGMEQTRLLMNAVYVGPCPQ